MQKTLGKWPRQTPLPPYTWKILYVFCRYFLKASLIGSVTSKFYDYIKIHNPHLFNFWEWWHLNYFPFLVNQTKILRKVFSRNFEFWIFEVNMIFYKNIVHVSLWLAEMFFKPSTTMYFAWVHCVLWLWL